MHYKKINKIFFCIILLMAASALLAKNDSMVVGKTYPILEEDLLYVIQTRAKEMQENGEWQHIQRKALQNVKKKIMRPEKVSGITRTEIKRTWHFDPSIRVPYDLSDHQGRVFAKAGEIINPLNTVSLQNVLIFFDGDDESQITCVKKLAEPYQHHVKLILVNGDIRETSNTFKIPIYFDQKGLLTTKFGIQHVPAIVKQEELQLNITEVVP